MEGKSTAHLKPYFNGRVKKGGEDPNRNKEQNTISTQFKYLIGNYPIQQSKTLCF